MGFLFSYWEFWYLLITFLFCLVYYRETVEWSDEFCKIVGSVFYSVVTCWWYWPVIVFYLIRDAWKKKKEENEAIVRRTRGY